MQGLRKLLLSCTNNSVIMHMAVKIIFLLLNIWVSYGLNSPTRILNIRSLNRASYYLNKVRLHNQILPTCIARHDLFSQLHMSSSNKDEINEYHIIPNILNDTLNAASTDGNEGSQNIQEIISTKPCAEIYYLEELNEMCYNGDIESLRSFLEEYDCKEVLEHHDPSEYDPPLVCAVMSGHLDIVKVLLQYGINCDHLDYNYLTALMWACLQENEDIIYILLDSGASIEKTNAYGNTVIHLVSAYGRINALKILVQQGASLSSVNKLGETVFIKASQGGHVETMQYLLTQGVDIHDKDKCNRTVLHHSICRGTDILVDEKKVKRHTLDIRIIARGANYPTNDRHSWRRTSIDTICQYAPNNYNAVQLLLQHGANINALDTNGNTPLIYACILGHLDVVQLLIENGADIHIRNNQNDTALIEACMRGHTEVVQYLLPLSQPDEIMNIPPDVFIEVCKNGYVDTLKALLNTGVSMNHSYCVTALNQAVINQHTTLVRILLQYVRIDINTIDNDGNSSLIYACSRPPLKDPNAYYQRDDDDDNDEVYYANIVYKDKSTREKILPDIDIVRLLLENGANVSITNKDGHTPLMIAARRGYGDIVKLLIEYGAEIDVNNTLVTASHRGHIDIVQLCLEKGAKANYKINGGVTAFYMACKHNHVDIVRILLKHGADINEDMGYNTTALIQACYLDFIELAQLLIDKGADINIINNHDMSALLWACFKEDSQLLYFMLPRSNVNINIQNSIGLTPLMMASQEGRIENVKLLLQYNVNLYIKERRGRTALQFALNWKHTEIVKLLLQAGAN